jgi:SAM-dependent methyltransferase
LGLPAIEALALHAGERVLDVGCGAGQTLVQLAEQVGSNGWVTGIDIAEPLVNLARARITASSHAHVDVVLADAESVVLDQPYDALFSRFGVMFFDDPAAAFVNLARSLRSAGRLAFLCWQTIDLNPWASLPLQAVRSIAPETPMPDMLLPGRPGPFRFGDPDLVRNILARAGFRDVALTPHATQMSFGGAQTVEEAVTFALEIGPSARVASQMPAESLPRARTALASVFQSALSSDGIRMLANTFVVTARRA